MLATGQIGVVHSCSRQAGHSPDGAYVVEGAKQPLFFGDVLLPLDGSGARQVVNEHVPRHENIYR